MKKPVLLIAALFFVGACFAQGNRNEYFKSLRQKEDTLKVYADKIIQSFKPFDRFNADSMFIKMFVRALKTPYSFSYPFPYRACTEEAVDSRCFPPIDIFFYRDGDYLFYSWY